MQHSFNRIKIDPPGSDFNIPTFLPSFRPPLIALRIPVYIHLYLAGSGNGAGGLLFTYHGMAVIQRIKSESPLFESLSPLSIYILTM